METAMRNMGNLVEKCWRVRIKWAYECKRSGTESTFEWIYSGAALNRFEYEVNIKVVFQGVSPANKRKAHYCVSERKGKKGNCRYEERLREKYLPIENKNNTTKHGPPKQQQRRHRHHHHYHRQSPKKRQNKNFTIAYYIRWMDA